MLYSVLLATQGTNSSHWCDAKLEILFHICWQNENEKSSTIFRNNANAFLSAVFCVSLNASFLVLILIRRLEKRVRKKKQF